MNTGRFALAAVLAALGGLVTVAPAQEKKPDAPAVQPPPQPAPQFEVEKATDVAYRTDPAADPIRHKLDVYVPRGQKGFPVLFFVHGGTWRSGNKNLYAALGNSFARSGVGVIITNYRLSPQVMHPAHVQDVARAYAWTIEHVADYGGDPKRVFPFGHSAGGHLVSLLATDPSYLAAETHSAKDVRGVISVSGVYQIYHDYATFNPIFGKDEKVCEQASPLWNVKGDHPPFLLAYGDKDFEHLDEMALDMNCALKRCRSPVTLLKLKDRNHYTIIMMVIGDDDPLRRAIQDFVAKYGK
jgi:acetyl esterase/lipase